MENVSVPHVNIIPSKSGRPCNGADDGFGRKLASGAFFFWGYGRRTARRIRMIGGLD
jgi:hypothetical protein